MFGERPPLRPGHRTVIADDEQMHLNVLVVVVKLRTGMSKKLRRPIGRTQTTNGFEQALQFYHLALVHLDRAFPVYDIHSA